MEGISLFSPPIAFVIVMSVIGLLSFWATRISFKKGPSSDDAQKAYSCGEEFTDHLIQPDYSQFFPFAFFFTMLHVVALMITTVPIGNIVTLIFPVIYVLGAIIGLFILLGR